MAYIDKNTRVKVWDKYDRKCAYCGTDLEYKQMQVDHIQAHWHGASEENCKKWKVIKGKHSEDNFNPSCARCNRWKGTFTTEQFRREISLQCQRLLRDSNQYRMAMDYGMIEETKVPVTFWFERREKLKTGT